MRYLLVICLLMTFGVVQESTAQKKNTAEKNYKLYTVSGISFEPNKVMDTNWMLREYGQLKEGDSIQVTFNADVNSVCKSKGCWMRLELEDQQEVMVRFRDYEFFVPKDIQGKDVVVNGKAFVTEMSVEDRRHYAKDGGATTQEIEAITEPKKTFSFLADGVLIEP